MGVVGWYRVEVDGWYRVGVVRWYRVGVGGWYRVGMGGWYMVGVVDSVDVQPCMDALVIPKWTVGFRPKAFLFVFNFY